MKPSSTSYVPLAATRSDAPRPSAEPPRGESARHFVGIGNRPAETAPARTTWGAFRHAVRHLFSPARIAGSPEAAPFSRKSLKTWAGLSGSHAEAARAVDAYHKDPGIAGHALDVRRMRLDSLPPFPPALLVNAFGNSLRTLPDELPPVRSLWIDLDRSAFPAEGDAQLVRSHPALSRVPHVQIGAPDPWSRTELPLHLAAALWFPEPAQCAVGARWLAHHGEPHARDFAVFLKALARVVTTLAPGGARVAVCDAVGLWLECLSLDPEERADVFAAAATLPLLDRGTDPGGGAEQVVRVALRDEAFGSLEDALEAEPAWAFLAGALTDRAQAP